MKKLTFLLLLFSCMAVAKAQPQMPSVRLAETHKGYDHLMANGSHIVSMTDNELIIVTHKTMSLLGSYGWQGLQVVVTDTNLNVLRQVDIPDTKLNQVVAANYVDGKVYVLHQLMIPTRLYRTVVDPVSMTVGSTGFLLNEINGYDLEYYNSLAQSDNGLFYALSGIWVNSTSKEVSARQILLDEKFQLLWEKQYETSFTNDVFVNDDGMVFLFGYQYDQGSRKTVVELSRLDVNEERRVTSYASLGEVYRLKLLGIVGNTAVASGYIRTPNSPKKTDCFDKMVGVSLNLDTEELKTDVVPFTSDELNVFGNLSTKKENKIGMVDNLVLTSITHTSYGGAMLIQREWKVTTHSTQAPDRDDYFTMGALAMAVDTNGTIIWHKPFRTVCQESNNSMWNHTFFLDAAVRAHGNDVFVFLPESARTPTVYDITNAVKKTKVQLQDHACSIYGISPNGEVSKQVHLLDDNACMMNVWKPLTPKKFVSMYASKKKTGLVYVNF